MLEPVLLLVPAAFYCVQFGKFRGKIPDVEGVTVDARDRTVSDSFGRSVSADVLPEIPRPEVACPVEKHHQLFSKSLFQRFRQPDSWNLVRFSSVQQKKLSPSSVTAPNN